MNTFMDLPPIYIFRIRASVNGNADLFYPGIRLIGSSATDRRNLLNAANSSTLGNGVWDMV